MTILSTGQTLSLALIWEIMSGAEVLQDNTLNFNT